MRKHKKPPRIEYSVKSLTEFMKAVFSLEKEWRSQPRYSELWFRGHASADWPLQPGIYRGSYNEGELRFDFRGRVRQFALEREPRNHWEEDFLMQHYGTPTRLLDWSDGAFLALHFAVTPREESKGGKGQRPAAVWVLDPGWLNHHVFKDDAIALADPEWEGWKDIQPWLQKDPFANLRRKYPFAIDPPHIARRMAVQRSHFTLFGSDKDGLAVLARKYPRSRLAKIVVDARGIKEVREQLEICGIKETTVYPDLEGLSRELRDEWRND